MADRNRSDRLKDRFGMRTPEKDAYSSRIRESLLDVATVLGDLEARLEVLERLEGGRDDDHSDDDHPDT